MVLAKGQRIPNENRPKRGPPIAPPTITPACLVKTQIQRFTPKNTLKR